MTENTITPKYCKKRDLAQRYQVSLRTIDAWMNAGLLVCIRVRHVIRFDVPACDQALRAGGLL